MKALITGATGFLGKNLSGRLLAEGHEVTAVGRNEREGKLLADKGARFLRLDLSSPDLAEAIKDHDFVFHCGALSSPWGAYRDFFESNVVGTRQVIEGCFKYGVKKLIYVSTPSIYFDYRDRLLITEDEQLPKRGVNRYAATKRLAEAEIDRAFEAGLPVVTIRPRALFGPGDTAIFPRLMRANEQRFLPVFGGGRALIDVTYIDNVTEALLCCLRADSSTLGQKYNITNGEPVQLFDLLSRLFERLDTPFHYKSIAYPVGFAAAALMESVAKLPWVKKEPLMTRYTVGILAYSQTLDISRAERELGYRPIVTIDEGIQRFCQWWKEQETIH
ncbi:nucleoside-diphosphate-sugar epimerase [Paenibacillus castaneae]|nr:NAD-dependent epimerase/dehydratase family protein [Paenibacillus castaneae]NIK75183.1 nucleoside-diphosphate-sugar epimerase [Paenibacillus castaneae]